MVVEISEKVRRVLPAPDEIEQIDDDILVAMSYEIFDLLPDPKRALGQKAHARPTILGLLQQLYGSCMGKAQILADCLLEILDPRDTGLVLAASFCDVFPFILRLVQTHDFEEKKILQRMESLSQVSFAQAAEEEHRSTVANRLIRSNSRAARALSSKTLSSARSRQAPLRSSSSISSFSTDSQSGARPRSPSPGRKSRSLQQATDNAGPEGRARSPSPGRKLGTQRKTMNAGGSPGGIVETARLRHSSASPAKAASNKGSGSSTGVGDERIRREQFRKKLKGLRTILQEADINGDGVVTWEELRSKAPGLPEEPEHMGIAVESDQGVDMNLLIKIMYPEDAKGLVKQHDEETNRKFILPKEKKREIGELFAMMSGDPKRDTMESLELYSGLRHMLQLDYTDAAAAYWHLIVVPHSSTVPSRAVISSTKNGKEKQEALVSLQIFMDWYIEHLLTDDFKNEHAQKKRSKKKLAAY